MEPTSFQLRACTRFRVTSSRRIVRSRAVRVCVDRRSVCSARARLADRDNSTASVATRLAQPQVLLLRRTYMELAATAVRVVQRARAQRAAPQQRVRETSQLEPLHRLRVAQRTLLDRTETTAGEDRVQAVAVAVVRLVRALRPTQVAT